jgi:hypothetical protein
LFFFLLNQEYSHHTLTGRAIYNGKTIYPKGANLEGTILFNLRKGESIPSESLVKISLGDFQDQFVLSDFVDHKPIKGTIYAENSELSGEGRVFGVPGIKKTYQEVEFELEIYTEQEIEETPEQSPSEETTPEETPDQSPENQENTNEEPSPETSDNGAGSSPVTGEVISEITKKTISGKASHDNPFTYQLEEGEKVRIVEGSVKSKNEDISENEISLDITDSTITITTDYAIEEEGFGPEYLGDESAMTFKINVKDLGLEATPGDLIIEISYEGKQIAYYKDTILVSDSELEEKPLETTLTQIQDIPSIRVPYGENAVIDLNDYFTGATAYSAEIENIQVNIDNNLMQLTPEENFRGARKAKIIASNDQETLESNEFLILVSSGALSIKTTREKIVLGQPVKWKKEITKEQAEEPINVEIPAEAENVEVKTLVDEQEEILEVIDQASPLTGNVVIEVNLAQKNEKINSNPKFIKGFKSWFASFKAQFNKKLQTPELTGKTIEEIPAPSDVVDIPLEEPGATDYIIEYETPAPEATEEVTGQGKIITISAPSELSYTDVIAFTNLENKVSITQPNKIKFYWHNYESSTLSQEEIEKAKTTKVNQLPDTQIVEEFLTTDSPTLTGEIISTPEITSPTFIREEVVFDSYDLDEDGFIDYIEWVVPHLSNQTYEIIIEITNAEHLDENRTFISDIFANVSALDNIWSETIPENHFVRVTFQTELTSDNDITLFPRTINGTPQIEVYEENSSEIIATFSSLTDNEYNKVYLTNLQGTQKTFDLKVINGAIELDHIIDPAQQNPSPNCYQETANQSTAGDGNCGLNYTGSYANSTGWTNLGNTFDGNWNTYGYRGTEGTSHLYINYSKPINAQNSSLWRVKTETDINRTTNNTIPSSCWDMNPLQFRIGSSYLLGGGSYVSLSCYNSTGLSNLATYGNSTTIYGYVYEEGMWWTISDETYPIFSSYWDNNASLVGNGIALFNVTVIKTNGTVFLEINNTNYTATNLTADVYNVSVSLSSGFYNYYWGAFGNGSQNQYNTSETRNYTVNSTDTTQNISSCQELNQTNTVYIQTDNIIPTGNAPCINITADNITFNGNGRWIVNTSFNNIGIYAEGRTNITLTNVNFTVKKAASYFGIRFVNTNNSLIKDSVLNSNFQGILLETGSSNNRLSNITANNNTLGIQLDASSNNTLSDITANSNTQYGLLISTSSNNNQLNNITANSNTQYGLLISTSSNNNQLNNITANSNSYGIRLSSSNNTLSDITANSNTQYGLGLSSPNNTFRNGIVNGSINYAIYFYHDNYGEIYGNNRYINISVSDTNVSGYDLFVEFWADAVNNYSIGPTYFIDTSLGNYRIINTSAEVQDYGISLIFENTHYGKIKFLDLVEGSGTNLSNDVKIGNNLVYVNSAIAGLNRSANITLIQSLIFNNPTILKNGVPCGSECYNFTSLNAGTVTFNVTSWSNYSIGELSQDLTPPNINFTYPTPANGSTQNNTEIFVNLTTNDSSTHYAFVNFDNDLLLWMRMDDTNASGDPTDLSSYSNNGSKIGNATQTDSGYFGKGFEFDGGINDQIVIPYVDGKTISFWVNSSQFAATLGFYSSCDENQWVGSNLYVSASNIIISECSDYLNTQVIGGILTNGWHHIVIVNNGTYVKSYVDSSYSSGANYYNSLFGTTTVLGYAYEDLNSYTLDGTLDEVLIFNRVLTQQEISALYNASANQYRNNFTNLAMGNHTFQGLAVDTAGNKNQTEVRTVTISSSSTNLTTCQNLNQENTTYYLQNDVTTNETCFNIQAKNITLECNGRTIFYGNQSNDTYFYGILSDQNYTTINNCTIGSSTDSSHRISIALQNNYNNKITNINFNHTVSGLRLTNSSNNNITYLTAISCCSQRTVSLSRSDYNFLNHIVSSNNPSSIFIYNSSNNIWINVTANNNNNANLTGSGITLSYYCKNNTFIDITASYNYNYGIEFISSSDAHNNTFRNIIANNNNGSGISITKPSSNNNFTDITANYNTNSGVYISGNNIVSNVTANGNNNGIALGYSNSSVISNFIVNNNRNSGVSLGLSNDGSNISNGIINSSLKYGIYISGALVGQDTSMGNMFKNVTITNTNASYYDLYFNSQANNTIFVDMPHIGNYSLVRSNSTITIRKTGVGEISFLAPVNGSGTNFTRDIYLTYNLAEVRSNLNPGLNVSANITLYSLPTDFTNPVILKNSIQQCTGCYNFTDLNAETVIFNVTDWTNYSIGEAPDTTPPNINFTYPTPANGSTQFGNSIYVNLSTNDSNNHYAFTNFNNDLLLWMRMDDTNASGDPTDLSSWSNNGTAMGNATQTDSGYFGKGFVFDGENDSIDFNNLFNFSDETTYSVWIKPHPETQTVIFSQLILLAGSPGLSIISDGEGEGYKIRFSFADGTGCYEGHNEVWVRSSLNITEDNWNHIVVEYYNFTNISIYLNGIEDPYVTRSLLCIPNSVYFNFSIGRDGNDYFNGTIDEVLIFNRSLTEQEIKALYNASVNKYFNNFTNLATGTHSFQGFAVDLAGNKNQTELRTVTLISSNVNLTTCTNLTQANTTYYLQNPVSSTTTCFYVRANNITLDCQNWSNEIVYGNQAFGTYYGVYTNYNATTIKNCEIRKGATTGSRLGIFIEGGNMHKVENTNTSFNTYGISVSMSTLLNLTGIIANNNSYGIYLFVDNSNATLNNITVNNNSFDGISILAATAIRNTTLSSITANSNGRYGLYLAGSSNNITDITANNNLNSGIYTTLLQSSYLTNIALDNNTKGIYVNEDSNYNHFQNILINNSRGSAIYIYSEYGDGNIDGNVLQNITVLNTNPSYYDLEANYYTGGYEQAIENEIVDMSLASYSIYGLNNIHFRTTNLSEIKFLGTITPTATGTNLSDDIKTLHNFVEVKNPNLNLSANITFNFSLITLNPRILRNGEECPASICYNFTPLDTETVIFNVTGWTNYSLESVIPPEPTDPPIIEYVLPIPNDYALTDNNNLTIVVNVALDSPVTLDTLRYRIYNSSPFALVNETYTNTLNLTFFNLPPGSYNYNVWVNDSSGNSDNSDDRHITILRSCFNLPTECTETLTCTVQQDCYLHSGMCTDNSCEFTLMTTNSTIYTLYDEDGNGRDLKLNLTSNSQRAPLTFLNGSKIIFSGRNGSDLVGGSGGGNGGIVNITVSDLLNTTNARFIGQGGYRTLNDANTGGNGGTLQINFHGLIRNFTSSTRPDLNGGGSAGNGTGNRGALVYNKDLSCSSGSRDVDISGNGIVDGTDGSIIQYYYNIKSNESGFLVQYDIKCDNNLNVRDLAPIGFEYLTR